MGGLSSCQEPHSYLTPYLLGLVARQSPIPLPFLPQIHFQNLDSHLGPSVFDFGSEQPQFGSVPNQVCHRDRFQSLDHRENLDQPLNRNINRGQSLRQA